MLGAIIGDIIGSRYEFANIKTKEFDLFHRQSEFTDDTIMTIAVAKALSQYDKIMDMEEFKKTLVEVMHEVGLTYPCAGYGQRFGAWLWRKETEPYNSFGNGSAMRVSPVAWYANSLEEAEALAKATAEVTHNHPEGIKGAQAIASAIYLARTGATKEAIRQYITENYYQINFTLDEIRPTYRFDVTCQGSCPQALQAFFESTDFEDAIRNAISIGGDSDTIAAMTGSIAEAYYGIPEEIKTRGLSYLDGYLSEETSKISFYLPDIFTEEKETAVLRKQNKRLAEDLTYANKKIHSLTDVVRQKDCEIKSLYDQIEQLKSRKWYHLLFNRTEEQK